MKIIIPSMGRASTMTTHRLVPEALVCVPESQAELYRATTPNVLAHPDAIKGKPAKLNWLFDRMAEEDCLLFLDDDLVGLQRCFLSPGERGVTITDPETVMAVIEGTRQLAEDAGAYLFGWAVSARDAVFYTGLKPFQFTGYINGTAMGFRRGHGLRFDERIIGRADYDICCQNAYRHRYCLRNMRYAFKALDTFTLAGGNSGLRNSTTEDKAIAILRRKWGEVIRFHKGLPRTLKDRQGSQRITLSIPF